MKRFACAVIAATVSTALLAVGVGLPSASSAAVTTYDVMSVQGDSHLAAGETATSQPGTVTMQQLAGGAGYFRLDFSSWTGDRNLMALLSPPTGTLFAVGSYDLLGTADATHAGMYVSLGSAPCESPGHLTVSQVITDGSGTVTAFAADYAIAGCSGDDAPVSGVIRFNSSQAYALATISPSYLDVGNVDRDSTSATHPFVVTNVGDQPFRAGAVTLGGTDSGSFVVTSDGCDGQTLNPGESCTVQLVAHPLVENHLAAWLVVPFGTDRTLSARMVGEAILPAAGAFSPLSHAVRILDTRRGLGAPKAPLGAGRTLHLQVAGRGGVPAAHVSAVVLNLTVTGTSSAGYVTAYPTGLTRPTASSINYPRGWTGANSVTVPVGASGHVDLFNCCGSVSLIADVIGWYAADDTARTYATFFGDALHLAEPQRLLDTRTWGYGKLGSHYYVDIPVDYGSDHPDLVAMVVNITALGVTSTGYVTAYPSGQDPTTTSTLNLRPGVITSNMAVVHVVDYGSGHLRFRVYNGAAKPVHLLVDAIGFYEPYTLPNTLRYRPLAPTRVVDTRTALGSTPLEPASTHTFVVPSAVADDSTWAVAANVTAVRPTSQTYLTLWPSFSGLARPPVSLMNPGVGLTMAIGTVAEVGSGNAVNVYNSTGTTNLVVDVSGTFQIYPAAPAAPASALRGASGAGSGRVGSRAGSTPGIARLVGAPVTGPPQPARRG